MDRRKWNYTAVWLLVAALWTGAQGQSTGARATVERHSILIGDQLKFALELTVPDSSKVEWPPLGDTLVRGIEILRRSTVDTVGKHDGYFTLRQELLITTFDSGMYLIPPIPFRYLQTRDTTRYYTESRATRLQVSSPETDPASDIKPLKAPLRAPVSFAEIAPWLGIAILVVLLALGAWYYLRRKKANQPVFQILQKPKLPPHEVALEALEGLRQKKLWQAGRVKDYYTELTDIIRVYIEERYGIMAMEMTTYEIIAALKVTGSPESARNKLYDTLLMADLVKFAKSRPLPDENDTSYQNCVGFVRETKPVVDLRSVETKSEPMEMER